MINSHKEKEESYEGITFAEPLFFILLRSYSCNDCLLSLKQQKTIAIIRMPGLTAI